MVSDCRAPRGEFEAQRPSDRRPPNMSLRARKGDAADGGSRARPSRYHQYFRFFQQSLGREGTVAMAKDFYGDEIPPGGHEISKLWLAMKALDRREFDECLGYCNAVLEKNPYDQVRPPPRSFSSLDADFHHPSHPSDLVPPLHPFPSQQVWYVKTRCLTLKMWVDDTELEEEVRPSPTVPSPPRPVFKTNVFFSPTSLMDASPLPSSPNAGCGRGSHGRERHRGDAPPRDIPTPPGDAHADRHAQPGHPTHHVIRSTHDRFPPPGHVQPASHRRRRHRGRVQGCSAGNHATSHHVRPHGPPGNRVHAFRTRRPVHQR